MLAVILNTILAGVSVYNGFYYYGAFCSAITLLNIYLYYKQNKTKV